MSKKATVESADAILCFRTDPELQMRFREEKLLEVQRRMDFGELETEEAIELAAAGILGELSAPE